MTESFTVPIHVPPLRERPEDILALCDRFIDDFASKYNNKIKLSDQAKEVLLKYDWPGNIRELENLIEYLAIFTSEDEGEIDGDLIDGILEPRKRKGNGGKGKETATPSRLTDSIIDHEKTIIQNALDVSRTLKDAANILGVDTSTVSRKIKQYNLKYGNLK